MTRDEFMKELAYLLQDIQDEDKDDAVQYYTDYFEEAGPDKEAEVIQELGSPERIAAIIRADIAGHLEDGGEFTEQGYQDERFRDPGYAMAKRLDLPEERENGGQGNYSRRQGFNQKRSFNQKQSFDQEPGKTYTEGNNGTSQTPPPRTSKVIKLILWAVLIIVAFPLFLRRSAGSGRGNPGHSGSHPGDPWSHHLCSSPGRNRYVSLWCAPHVFPSPGRTHDLRHRINPSGRRCPVPGPFRTVLRKVRPFRHTKYRQWA